MTSSLSRALPTVRMQKPRNNSAASLGDAVIATDEHGRVTFPNAVTEHLIGIDVFRPLERLVMPTYPSPCASRSQKAVVLSSAGKKHSIRNSSRVTSRGPAKVVIVSKKRSSPIELL